MIYEVKRKWYPETFIQFIRLMYTFLRLPHRKLEGYLQALSGFIFK
jgi:hypothetical protein